MRPLPARVGSPEAAVFVLNLECCIYERGRGGPIRAKPFFFRAPAQLALRDLAVRLAALEQDEPPFAGDTLPRRGVHWVRPERSRVADDGTVGLNGRLRRL